MYHALFPLSLAHSLVHKGQIEGIDSGPHPQYICAGWSAEQQGRACKETESAWKLRPLPRGFRGFESVFVRGEGTWAIAI